eukprot:403351423
MKFELKNCQSENNNDLNSILNYSTKIDCMRGQEKMLEIFEPISSNERFTSKSTLSAYELMEPSKKKRLESLPRRVTLPQFQIKVVKFETDNQILEKAESQIKYIENKVNNNLKSALLRKKLEEKLKRNQKGGTQSGGEDTDSDSDCELPPLTRINVATVSGKEYLKLFRQQNSTHDRDRENAKSIAMNLVLPNQKVLKGNPLFNKEDFHETEVNLHKKDLYQICQMTGDDLENVHLPVYDDQIFEKKLQDQVRQELNLDGKLNCYLRLPGNQNLTLKNESSSNLIDHLETKSTLSTINKDLMCVNQFNDIKSEKRNHRFSSLLNKRTDQRFSKLSQLSQQVYQTPQIYLKKIFSKKIMEYDSLNKAHKFDQYDSNSIYSGIKPNLNHHRNLSGHSLSIALLNKEINNEPAPLIASSDNNQITQLEDSNQIKKELKPIVNDYLNHRDNVMTTISKENTTKQLQQLTKQYNQSLKNHDRLSISPLLKKRQQLSHSKKKNVSFKSPDDPQDSPSLFTTISPSQFQSDSQSQVDYDSSTKSIIMKKNNQLFQNLANQTKDLFQNSKSVYQDYFHSEKEQKALKNLKSSSSRLRDLNHQVSSLIENQQSQQNSIQQLGIDQDYSMGSYKTEYDQKVKDWCNNQIRALDYESQRMEYYSCKKNFLKKRP